METEIYRPRPPQAPNERPWGADRIIELLIAAISGAAVVCFILAFAQ